MRHRHIFLLSRGLGVLLLVLFCVWAPHAIAANCATNQDQQSCSSQYGVSETFFGSGGLDTCPTVGSNAYCAKMSAGELTVGNTKGNQFQAQAGFNTDRTPYIEAVVTKTSADLGVVSSTATGYDTAAFTVKSYLSSGYVVQIYGSPPSYGSHIVTALATPSPSTQGTEQFGMNLVDNATPNVGANPTQTPDSSFAFGTVASGYNTADSYKFVSGDIIASSNQSSSYTNYTISFIMNATAVTPAGTYLGYESIVATGTY